MLEPVIITFISNNNDFGNDKDSEDDVERLC